VDQGRTVRLETRAGESTAVASLKGSKPCRRRETDMPAAGFKPGEGRGPKGPGVTAVGPETERSRRGQGEAGGNPGGGPKGF
jgi:hypothetical protein